MMDSQAKLSGFSLIEVAVVIVIVVIVSALLAPLLAGLVDVDRSELPAIPRSEPSVTSETSAPIPQVLST
jgi:prepilin-type N-terminal cleavage/methylation domain-containing protein